MYELISGQYMQIREYSGQRVVTFKDIDTVHQRPEGTARKRFNDNRKHFIEGVDFFTVKPSDFQMSEIRTSDFQIDEFRPSEINNRGTTLLTESGYLMIVKSFTDDLAWKVQRELVNTYFKARAAAAPRNDDTEQRLDRLERLIISIKSAPERRDIEQDCIAAFVSACCMARRRPVDEVTTKVFYDAFLIWCGRNGIIEPPGKQAVISWLLDYYGTNDLRKIRKYRKTHGTRHGYYCLTLTPKAKRDLGII